VSKYGIFVSEFKAITGHDMETNTLDKRIICQKIAYLLNKKGLASSYTNFFWYLHGVFSWDLWNDTLTSADIPESITLERSDILNQIKNEFSNANLASYFDDHDKLELVTTILYCAQKQEDLRDDNTNLITMVLSRKSKFNEAEIKTAINLLRNIQWVF
jgi:uncharacterized protein YwgA